MQKVIKNADAVAKACFPLVTKSNLHKVLKIALKFKVFTVALVNRIHCNHLLIIDCLHLIFNPLTWFLKSLCKLDIIKSKMHRFYQVQPRRLLFL